jgi:cytochrome P450
MSENHVQLSGYYEVVQALRLPGLLTENSAGDGAFRHGTLLRLNGPDHTRRRRALNRLIRNHAFYRETILYPALEANLADVLRHADAMGAARTDLIDLVSRTSIKVAAAMIGLGPLDENRFEELLKLAAAFRQLPGVRWVRDPARREELVGRAMEARRTFEARFFRPALEAHQELVQRYMSEELDPDELPSDFLMLFALHSYPDCLASLGMREDPSYRDFENAVGEAATAFINGAVDTTSSATTWSFHELTAWFGGHPEDSALRSDPEFLRGAVWESLRLHPGLPGLLRDAGADVQLADGRRVPQGTRVDLRTALANRDASVYGQDADQFNPRREVPRGVAPYGLAFGAGGHMCYGMPLVLGDDGSDGSLVGILIRLYAAGIGPDTAAPPQLAIGTDQERFISYPVMFVPA